LTGSARRQGHLVDSAYNGRDALLLAAATRYDAIAIDGRCLASSGLFILATER
jgi:hypothetical protein